MKFTMSEWEKLANFRVSRHELKIISWLENRTIYLFVVIFTFIRESKVAREGDPPYTHWFHQLGRFFFYFLASPKDDAHGFLFIMLLLFLVRALRVFKCAKTVLNAMKKILSKISFLRILLLLQLLQWCQLGYLWFF